MPDLDFQQLSTVQNNLMQLPRTIVAAATVAPTTFLTFFSAGVAITTITPPVTGCHMLAFVFAGITGVATGGNINTTVASIAGRVMFLVYNPITATYSVSSAA